MFPIRDQNRSQTFPFLTYGIIAINVLVFLYQARLSPDEERDFIRDFGLKPAFVVGYLKGEERVIYREPVVVRDAWGQPAVDFREKPMRVDFWNALFPF